MVRVRTCSVRAHDSHTGVQSNIYVHFLQEDLIWIVSECRVIQLQKGRGDLFCFWEPIDTLDQSLEFKG
jgi:hypothetical protein